MNSRWQANRIGFVNFWYYDEQDFSFANGRMLLRGANGSGKSVTMQSIIPLLLDGNTSPSRLDPFGSRDRKMSGYLLEEDDDREERTGYIYMEFKRQENDVWLTIGMGIRARRGKPLDTWYFTLEDGRRIGHDFLLYKETSEKVPLSKRELENRIATGGRVFDRQADYMSYVNQQIFGFETPSDYKEMLDLLIQLRTPKLSKEFKPSVINDILAESLQPLSEEDLRPMAEAIENLDTWAMNLKSLGTAKKAAEKVQRVWERYNKYILFEKASYCVEVSEKLRDSEKAMEKLKKEEIQCQHALEKLEKERLSLETEKEEKETLRDTLGRSDVFALKNQEADFLMRIKEHEALLESKAQQLEDKVRQEHKLEGQKKQEKDKIFLYTQELDALLTNMQAESEKMAFEEHSFFEEDLKKEMGQAFSFDSHEAQLLRTEEGIEAGLDVLEQVEQYQRQADIFMQKRDQLGRQIDAAQRRENERINLLEQIESEWREALYAWARDNEELYLSEEVLRKLAQFAERYDAQSDFSEVRNVISDYQLHYKSELSGMLSVQKLALEQVEKEGCALASELEEWEAYREPEPLRSEAVLKNRARLSMLGVPYTPFYKLIDFNSSMNDDARDRLEEALLEMGVLDALVVEENWRERVLAVDPGCADRYLFVQPKRADDSLKTQLILDPSVQDLFAYQNLNGILEGISWGKDCLTATVVHVDGSYQIGAVTGTISGSHHASYIGVQARERARQEKIIALQENLSENRRIQKKHQDTIAHLKMRLSILQKEFESLPKDDDLREAWHLLNDVQRQLLQLQEERKLTEDQLHQLVGVIKDLLTQATEIAGGLYLTPNYNVFQQAEKAARTYRRDLERLKSVYELYLQLLAHLHELDEQLNCLADDQENIRYDCTQTERALTKARIGLQGVREQLALTDYDEVRNQLDACLNWLAAYSGTFARCVTEQTRLGEQLKLSQRKQEENKAQLDNLRSEQAYYMQSYEAEHALGYVVFPDEFHGEAKLVKKYLATDCQTLEKGQLEKQLYEKFYENQSSLLDYQPAFGRMLFQEMDQEEFSPVSRLDLQARYRGERVPFGELLPHLQEEEDELEILFQNADRELFEDILTHSVSRKIRGKINNAEQWVKKMNTLMGDMDTSSGLKFHLRWRSRAAEVEAQLDTRELVELLKKDYGIMREEEAERLSKHFRSKVNEARRRAGEEGGAASYYQIMEEILDYRKWFEFQLLYQKGDGKQRELTNSAFGTFSGGEKAMAMYVPLFSAVAAKYEGARMDAPRLISLDEAFAGVDNRNIRDMFRLMSELEFDFIINSQVLWGDYDTLDAIAVYQLLRPQNAKYVTVLLSVWNGKKRIELAEA